MAKMTVEDSSLTAVADAIRSKRATTEPLVFPDEFINAVWDINRGLLAKIINKEIEVVTEELLEGCNSIPINFFANNSMLRSVSIPSTVVSIEEQAFYNCSSLTSLVIPEGVVSLGARAVAKCSNLEELTLPSTLTTFTGRSHFRENPKLKSMIIPSGMTKIPDDCFYKCTGLETVVMHDGIIEIELYGFQDCTSLANINIPKYLKKIGLSAFDKCQSIKSLVLPETVEEIGNNAFMNTNHLEVFEIKAMNPPTAGNSLFAGSTVKKIIVPAGTLSAYQSATNWSAYADLMVEAPE